MTQEQQFKAPTADGRMMYPHAARLPGFVAWVTPVTELKGFGGYNAPKLLVVTADVTEIAYTANSEVRPTVITYSRDRDNAAFPAEISPADWPEFRDSIGYDDDDNSLADRLYTAVRTPQEVVTRTVDLTGYLDMPVSLLDPESVIDSDASFTWQVAAPYLVFGEVYAGAMPGALIDIRERLAKEVAVALPYVSVYVHSARTDGVVSGSVTLGYEDRRTFPVKVGRRTEQRPSSKLFTFSFPIPKNIIGSSKADALMKYRALVEEITGQIADKKAVVCSHCSGEGVIVA
jgi:hypothetical protein